MDANESPSLYLLETTLRSPASSSKRKRAYMQHRDDTHAADRCVSIDTVTGDDVAAALDVQIVSDVTLQKVILPGVRAVQRQRGAVPLATLAKALASVLQPDCHAGKLKYMLRQCSADRILFAADIRHAQPEQAGV